MFFRTSKSEVEFIIVGLGNPGKKHENTRHNIGFDALAFAAEKWGIAVRKSKFEGLYGNGVVSGKKVVLLKPLTFMNLSGQCIKKTAAFYKVPPEKVLIVFDDVSLLPGQLRIRTEGSAGGHNGLKSIVSHMGQNFPRIKIGVGDRPHQEYDLASWVLSRFTPAERKVIEERFGDIANAAELIVGDDFPQAMNLYNGDKR